ncbi:Protein SPIRAL1-like 2 [Abeliophyllum distichum]|uniref:Protein SPIRAL1-like 2 n=1 Tax=Abeliophyllum distichum TaxID=126358 RepID=A0ABD1V3X1_9LAMI
MGRGVGAGGGQSSLGYLFGSGAAADNPPPAQKGGQSSLGYLFGSGAASDNPPPATKGSNNEHSSKPSAASQTVDSIKQQAAAGIRSNTTTNSLTNNYLRADGQHCGNFISVRH